MCAQWGKVPTVRVAFVFSVLLPLAPAYCRSAHFSMLKSTQCACVCVRARVCVHTSVSSESPGSYNCSQLLSLRHSLLCPPLWRVLAVTLSLHADERLALITAGSFLVVIFGLKGFSCAVLKIGWRWWCRNEEIRNTCIMKWKHANAGDGPNN